jgi:hypothetical protein
VPCLTHDRNASGRSSLQLEQVRSASPAVHISLGVCQVATCVTGKASANDTKDEPSAMVKAALLTSSSLTAPLPAPDGDSPLISDPRPALELGVVQWHTPWPPPARLSIPAATGSCSTWPAGLAYHDPAVMATAGVPWTAVVHQQ